MLQNLFSIEGSAADVCRCDLDTLYSFSLSLKSLDSSLTGPKDFLHQCSAGTFLHSGQTRVSTLPST